MFISQKGGREKEKARKERKRRRGRVSFFFFFVIGIGAFPLSLIPDVRNPARGVPRPALHCLQSDPVTTRIDGESDKRALGSQAQVLCVLN